MASAIQNLLEHALGDGARPSKFDLQVIMPTVDLFPDSQVMNVLAKSSSFPGKNHEMIPIKHKGRTIPVRGQTRYTNSWDVTFYLTEDHSLKIAFEQWIEALDQQHNYDHPSVLKVDALQRYFASSDTNYTMPIVITQKNFNLDEDRVVYTLQNAFPVAINQVEVSSETVGNISEFTVTFAYSHYLVNAVAYDSTNVEQWTNDITNIFRDSINASTSFISGITNNLTSQLTSSINSTIGVVIKEITGTASNAVSNLAQSMLDDIF